MTGTHSADSTANESPATDSHGQLWSGRTLGPQPFAGDAGEADAALARALTEYAAARTGEIEVMTALAAARVLVPVIATAEEGNPLPDHVRGDAGAEMSIPLLGADDQVDRALPIFTSTAALTAWNPAARPVPVEARRAALSAVDEGCEALVLDPGGPATFVVRRPMLWALAQGRDWLPPAEDPEVAAAVRLALEPVTTAHALRGAHCEQGRRAELAVVITLEPGLDGAALAAVLRRVGELLAEVPLVAERTESLELRPITAATDGDRSP